MFLVKQYSTKMSLGHESSSSIPTDWKCRLMLNVRDYM